MLTQTRGKLLSTLRLGLSRQAPDHKATDQTATRDQRAQLARDTTFREQIPRKALSEKLDLSP